MDRLDRTQPLPAAMQGKWADVEDPSFVLTVDGGEISCGGQVVEYDYKLVGEEDGAVLASLKIEDESRDDEFQSANVTELVITPEGEFHGYNVNFGSQFERVSE